MPSELDFRFLPSNSRLLCVFNYLYSSEVKMKQINQRISRRIIKEMMKTLYNNLEAPNPRLARLTLEMLALIVKSDPSNARDLFVSFNFAYKVFIYDLLFVLNLYRLHKLL